MLLGVGGQHHWDFKFFKPFLRQRDTYIATVISNEFREAPSFMQSEATHLVCLIKKAIFSVVILSAAIMRSPSFSRDSSSMTTRNSPRWNASTALFMLSKAKGAGPWDCDTTTRSAGTPFARISGALDMVFLTKGDDDCLENGGGTVEGCTGKATGDMVVE